jgi:hypothetical protein
LGITHVIANLESDPAPDLDQGGDDDQPLDADTAELRDEHAGALEDLTHPPGGSRGHAVAVQRFADLMLAGLLDGDDQRRCYLDLGWQIVREERNPALVPDAFDATMKAMGQTSWRLAPVANPGAYFCRTLQSLASDTEWATIETGQGTGSRMESYDLDQVEPFVG